MRLAIALLFATALIAADPVSLGGFHGSLKTYFPNVTVKDVTYWHNSATTGASPKMPDILNATVMSLLSSGVEFGQKRCLGTDAYALDNIHIQYEMIGEQSALVHVSANVVCVDY
ncbi:MAG: hypothetical protein JXK05_13565 [Campylobacterales bacterium]|nr:hypothetical protein [Campylobacterales bacterium]